MQEKLDSLVNEFFKLHNTKAETSFLNYLRLYLEPSKDITVSTNDVLCIAKRHVLDINLSIFSSTEIKLIYVLCKLASIRRKRPKIMQKSKSNLKKIALGLETVEKCKLDVQQSEILQTLQNNAVIYTKFKNVTDGQTMSQLHFYKIAKDKAKEFEMQVLVLNEEDILAFYVQLKPYIKTFILLDQINGHFQDTKNPYNFLKFYSRDFFAKEDSLIYNIVSNCTKQLNINLNEWLVKGQFTDYAREFFITKNSNDFWLSYNVDTGMLPFFISAEIAQKILYIGKVSNLLERISNDLKVDYSKEVPDSLKTVTGDQCVLDTRPHDAKAMDVSYEHTVSNHTQVVQVLDRNFENIINDKLLIADQQVKTLFLLRCQIIEYLQFCKDTFFFARNDFIEHLLFHMKGINKSNLCRRSYSFVLDSAIMSSFKQINKITSTLDMCVLKDEDFSLFCHFDFPVNVVIEKDVVMIFLSIFKYLWKIKRVEHFLRKLKEKESGELTNTVRLNKWYVLIQKIFFYFLYEIIEKNYVELLSIVDNKIFVVDELRKGVKKFLRNVINGIFQENGSGKEQMDIFINVLEQECLNYKKYGRVFDDSHIKKNLEDLMVLVNDRIENTTLFNIAAYV